MLGKIIERVESPYSGSITVIERFGRRELVTTDAFGNRFSQSGPIVAKLWAPTLKRILKGYQDPLVLMLGLGGGTLIDIIKTYSKTATINVVELDPIMVELATTYFDINPVEVSIFLDDARDFVFLPKAESFEVICVDLFCHEYVPSFLEDRAWLTQLRRILAPHGTIVVNRLLYGKHKQMSRVYIDKLRGVFYIREVNRLPSRFAASNVLIVCSKHAV